MQKPPLHTAIVGHVDHGKSTLIGRLLVETHSLPAQTLAEIRKISKALGKDAELAFLTDQLKEEREGSLTIDTAQRVIRSRKRVIHLIDTPGHAAFIKNMLTGATLADSAILVVDIQEGVQEQTRVHARLLKLLGITRPFVAINKMDAAGYSAPRFDKVRQEVTALMDAAGLEPAAIIPLSAKEGVNISRRDRKMSWYRGPVLLEALNQAQTDSAVASSPLRFPVQDIYVMDGEEILVGRVASGTVRVGQAVSVLPSNKRTAVESLKVFGQKKSAASAEECIGLTLHHKIPCERGCVISDPDSLPEVTSRFTGQVFWMAAEPLCVREKARILCATQEAAVTIENIEDCVDCRSLRAVPRVSGSLKQNQMASVTFETDRPMVVEPALNMNELGRFVIQKDHAVRGVGMVRR